MNNKLRLIAEYQFFKEMIEEFPEGILSLVSDTFDLFTVITEIVPRLKDEIMARDGKLVIRPDSGDPVDIICGLNSNPTVIESELSGDIFVGVGSEPPEYKGVIEILWDIFGGTTNEQGYKVLDSHIGAIYGDSINLDRQIQIYERLESKGFACTNIVLGIGSFTYQFNTRDTFGYAVKGSWFVADGKEYNIYKEPATDDGTKTSLKGKVRVDEVDGEYVVTTECSNEEEQNGLLRVIYENGKFFNRTTLTTIRERINKIS